MDDALRVNHYLYLLRLEVEQPLRLDHLEPFIHEGGRIDGDLCTHAPVRMLEGMIPFDVDQEIGFLAEEGSAGSRENDLFDAAARLANETLKDRRMFGIHGDDRGLFLQCLLHDDIAGHHEGLFVRKGYRLSVLNGSERWTKTGEADDCRQHHIIYIHGCYFLQRLLAREHFDRMSRKRGFYLCILFIIRDNDDIRLKV